MSTSPLLVEATQHVFYLRVGSTSARCVSCRSIDDLVLFPIFSTQQVRAHEIPEELRYELTHITARFIFLHQLRRCASSYVPAYIKLLAER